MVRKRLVVAERRRWRRRGRSGTRGGIVNNPHSMCSRSDKLRHRMGQGRVRVDMEDRVGILAVIHTTIGKYHGDEMDAGVFE